MSLFIPLVFMGISLAEEEPLLRERMEHIKVGMEIEKEELEKRLGSPQHKARQVLYRRHIEQWFYTKERGWLIILDCRSGEAPRIRDILSPIPKDRPR